MSVLTSFVGLDLRVEEFSARLLATDPRQSDARSLNRFEYKAFSQSGEDGILHEIFRRLGVDDRGTFVEVGVGDGLENNTVHLLQSGWRGLWLEADVRRVASIRQSHAHWIGSAALSVAQATVSPVNALSLARTFVNSDVELDLLSVDIDGNDYWVWESLMPLMPKVAVIEYNAHHGPYARWIMAYQEGWASFDTTYHGASLSALTDLGERHGYGLVGCSLSGANAFFVRKDLIDDQFLPVEPKDVWQPLRLSLVMPRGHRPKVGPCITGPQALDGVQMGSET